MKGEFDDTIVIFEQCAILIYTCIILNCGGGVSAGRKCQNEEIDIGKCSCRV